MKDSKFIVLIAFVLTLGAGVVGGIVSNRLTIAGPAPQPRSALAAELQLTPQQNDQMRQIWEGVRDAANEDLLRVKGLQAEREKAILALLSDDQKSQYDKLTRDFNARVSKLQSKRAQSFQHAVEQTEKMLNDSQREKYRKLVRQRTGHDPADPFLFDTSSPGNSGKITQ